MSERNRVFAKWAEQHAAENPERADLERRIGYTIIGLPEKDFFMRSRYADHIDFAFAVFKEEVTHQQADTEVSVLRLEEEKRLIAELARVEQQLAEVQERIRNAEDHQI